MPLAVSTLPGMQMPIFGTESNGTPSATVKSNADTLAKSLDLYRD